MGSKTLFPHVVLLVLALHLSSAALALPVIHVTSLVGPKSPPVIIRYRANSQLLLGPPIELKPHGDFQIKVEANEVYYLSATLDLAFSKVLGYEPARDGGRAAVYWRADDWGLSISYDNSQFKQVEQWETE